MVALGPRECIATNIRPLSAATLGISGSAAPADTSLMIEAPSSAAIAAVPAFIVSMLTGMPRATSSRITGTTRRCSSSTGRRSAPGRVDSPPTSTMSAPLAISSAANPTADVGSSCVPPSLNESGVTLRMPRITGRTGAVGSAPAGAVRGARAAGWLSVKIGPPCARVR